MRTAGFGSVMCMAVFLPALGRTPPAAMPEYPVEVITPLVRFPPGGSTDLAGRGLGEKITQNLEQAVILERRAGSAGGIRAVRNARADGHSPGASGMGPSAKSLALGWAIGDDPANLAHRGQIGSIALFLSERTDLEVNSPDVERTANLPAVQDLDVPGDKNKFRNVRSAPKGLSQPVIDQHAATLSATLPNITQVPEVSHENSLAGIPDERAGCSPGAGTANA